MANLAQEVNDQIGRALSDSGLEGFLAFKEQYPPIVTSTYVQVCLEFWIKDAVENKQQHVYLKIEERRSAKILRERVAYWYGLIDCRDGQNYYEGYHFHEEGGLGLVPHHKVVKNENLIEWKRTSGTISLASAALYLLRVYWERSPQS